MILCLFTEGQQSPIDPTTPARSQEMVVLGNVQQPKSYTQSEVLLISEHLCGDTWQFNIIQYQMCHDVSPSADKYITKQL